MNGTLHKRHFCLTEAFFTLENIQQLGRRWKIKVNWFLENIHTNSTATESVWIVCVCVCAFCELIVVSVWLSHCIYHILTKNEELPKWNTYERAERKLKLLALTEIPINQKRVKWHHLYWLFTYIHPLLIDKDLREHWKSQIFSLLFYMCLSCGDLSILSLSVTLIFQCVCNLSVHHLSLFLFLFSWLSVLHYPPFP